MKWKLLIYSHVFAPSLGGVETITLALAEGLAGWSKIQPEEIIEVTVVTQTAASVTPTNWLETLLKLKHITSIDHEIPDFSTHTLRRHQMAKIFSVGRIGINKRVYA